MRLVFVYNANSGWVNAFADTIHKIVSPETYACALCSLTHGVAGMKGEVKRYLNASVMETVCYHSDEIPQQLNGLIYSAGGAQAVLLEKEGRYHVLISVTELKPLKTSADFLSKLSFKLRQYS